MAFVTKEWKDRIVEFAGRRRLTNVSTQAQEVVDVERAEGTVSQAGDAFSAANMNDLEQRISDEFTAVNENLTALQDATIYSSDEVKIGTYFSDDLYRKSYKLTNFRIQNGATFSSGLTNLGFVKSINGTWQMNSTNNYEIFPFNYTQVSWQNSKDYFVGVRLKPNMDFQFNCGNASDWSSFVSPCVCIDIEYTKA